MSFAEDMRAKVRKLLKKLGLDVKFVTSDQKTRERHAREKAVKRWRFIASYSPKMILDIGANVGQFASIARQIVRDAHIVSFEPLADCCRQLRSQEERLQPLTVVHAAVGETDGVMMINRNASSPSSSLLPMHQRHHEELPHTAQSTTEKVCVRRLDDVFDELNVAFPLIVKIDVQGYTLPVLMGGRKTIRQAAAVIAEISTTTLYEGEATFDQVYQVMSSLNFDFGGTVDQWVSKQDGSVLQMDCLFVNRDFKIGINH